MSRRYLILAAALLPATSFGQAWLPDKGVFNATLIYNDVSNLAHWGSTWDAPPQPDGSIDVKARTLAFLGNYGITDRWTVSAALPYVVTRYKGPPSRHASGDSAPGGIRSRQWRVAWLAHGSAGRAAFSGARATVRPCPVCRLRHARNGLLHERPRRNWS